MNDEYVGRLGAEIEKSKELKKNSTIEIDVNYIGKMLEVIAVAGYAIAKGYDYLHKMAKDFYSAPQLEVIQPTGLEKLNIESYRRNGVI